MGGENLTEQEESLKPSTGRTDMDGVFVCACYGEWVKGVI